METLLHSMTPESVENAVLLYYLMNTQTAASTPPHPVCEPCGRTFNSPEDLERHRLSNPDSRMWTCKVCAQKFHRKANCQDHQLTHAYPRPFYCPLCPENRGFVRRSDLIAHTKRKHAPANVNASIVSEPDVNDN